MDNFDLLRFVWYLIIGFLLVVYSLLDGFDLGIGSLFKFLARDEKEKRALFSIIGPVWDGNEVWLITGGAALFAAFPQAYATVFSGFYLALMLVLFALIFRAVAIEFWNYDEKRRTFWEWAFVTGSFLPSLLFGVALGNVISGIPLNENMDFTGNFFTLLRPYPLVIGLLGLTAILLQGSTYTALKTTGSLQEKARQLSNYLWILFVVFFVLSFFAGLLYTGEKFWNIFAIGSAFVVWLSLVLNRNYLNSGNDRLSFYMSSLSFIGLWGIVGGLHFPNLVRAGNNPDYSLTIYNASSSDMTLKIMLLIVVIGMPLVIGYTFYVYRIFKGKVNLN